jgi:hypothetical protein
MKLAVKFNYTFDGLTRSRDRVICPFLIPGDNLGLKQHEHLLRGPGNA